jgi:hypothetical protein
MKLVSRHTCLPHYVFIYAPYTKNTKKWQWDCKDKKCTFFWKFYNTVSCLYLMKLNKEVYPYLMDVCSLSPDKITFFDWCSPPETSCKYSATADLAITSNLRASSSHTQQWTPRRPENTHSKWWNPKSSEEQMLVHNNGTKYYWDTCVFTDGTLQMVHNNKRSTITV